MKQIIQNVFKEYIQILKRINSALSTPACSSYSNFCFQAKQIKCFEYLLQGHHVVAILPTGYGKSLIFHLLPWILPQKSLGEENIVLVICPLSSIIKDQISVLSKRGIRAETLPIIKDMEKSEICDSNLFQSYESKTSQSCFNFSNNIIEAKLDILFGHPESF